MKPARVRTPSPTPTDRVARLRLLASLGLIGLGILTIAFDVLTWWIGALWILLGAIQLWEARRTAARIKHRNSPRA